MRSQSPRFGLDLCRQRSKPARDNYLRGSALALGLLLSAFSANLLAQGEPSPDSNGSAASGGLEEIIVTASRREENLQKESRAVSVLNAEELVRNGVTDPLRAQQLVPGLTIARNGSQLQVSIRGVGDRTINSATDPAVALNIDGIYYPKSFEGSASFFDLERIEVLKGPQGTLYGRNASSGAINLITVKPKFETSGFGEVEVGNYSNERYTAAVNTSFSDWMAIRFAGQVVDRGGYLSDGYNDEKNQAARLQVLIAPREGTSLLISGAYSHLGGRGDAAVIARRFADTPSSSPVPDPSDRWAGPTDPATLARVAATNRGYEAIIQPDGFQDIDVYSLAATFEQRLPWATVTLIPSYVESSIENLNYAALVVPSYLNTDSNQLAMEGRLSAPEGSPIRWVVGGFASKENVDDQAQARIPFPGGSFDLVAVSPHRDDRTWAAFGEANASLTDSFRAIAGARYTWEKKIVQGYTAGVFGPIPHYPLHEGDAAFPTTGIAIDGTRVDTATNFRIGVEYDVATQSMLYATVSTGFKAGGFYANIAPNNSYAPEKLTSYQIGAKNRFLDNRLQVNVEGYYWKYKDKQETFLALLPIGNVLVTQNAGDVSMYGTDVSLMGQISSRDVLSAEVEYLHSKYDSYVYTYQGAPDLTINCGTSVTGAFTTRDCSGYSLVRAPQWSGHVGYEHTQPLGDAGHLVFSAQMTFSSSYFLANNFTALTRADAYQTYDASLAWVSANDKFTVTGFVRNIGNEAVYTGGVQSASLNDAVVGQIGAPRTYGIRLRAGF